MIKSRLPFCLLCIAALLSVRAIASPVLYYSTVATGSAGLGSSTANDFTTAVKSSFGAANVKETANFSNTATFSDASALFINLRGTSDALSGQELTNIKNFINAGGAVFFVGEHNGWETWDNSFLGIYGDSVSTWGSISQAAKVTAAGASLHLLPSEGNQINVSNPGAILNGHGTSLFEGVRPMAELYGSNTIAFLDSNPFSSNSGSSFYEGVASWLYTTAGTYEATRVQSPGNHVPDASIGTLPLLLLGLSVMLRLRRR